MNAEPLRRFSERFEKNVIYLIWKDLNIIIKLKFGKIRIYLTLFLYENLWFSFK